MPRQANCFFFCLGEVPPGLESQSDAGRFRRPTDKRKEQYKSKRKGFGPEAFHYDEASGKLICPAGKRLYSAGKNMTTTAGYRVDSFRASKQDCASCELRTKCLKNPEQTSPRQVRLFNGKTTESITSTMKDKIDTPEGRSIYSRRLGNVEPVFANIAAQKGMNRSTLRGKAKVTIQWRLYCMVHNPEKIARYGHSRN